MNLEPTMLIAIFGGIFVSGLALVGAFVYRDYSGTKNLDRRLDRLAGGAKVPTLEEAGIIKESLYPEDAKGILDDLLPQIPSLAKLFEQADFKMKPNKFLMICGVLAFGGAMLPIFMGLSFFSSPVGAAICAPLPLLYVLYLRKKRFDKFGAQLCEALELIARALRAGHSLASGMHVVHDEMPDPISKEFGRVYEEQNLGLSIEEAMRNLADRVPNLDLKFFVTAVIIQRQTGGDLAEILDKIGYIIRERFKIIGMVKALTGEGRISGVVLISLPFVCVLALMYLNYPYVSMLWTHPFGRKMALAAIISMIFGALVIRKIVNIKI